MPNRQPPSLVDTALITTLMGLCLLTLARAGFADPPAPSAASPTHAAPLGQITVRARRELEHRVQHFVSNVTGSLVSDFAVQLWHDPLCPAIVGVSRSTGELMLAHMERTMRPLGVPLGKTGCRPNFLLVVTSQPEVLLKAMRTRWPRVFDNPSAGASHAGAGTDVQSFIDTARPVRIWLQRQRLVRRIL
jgi:hypothetical protein